MIQKHLDTEPDIVDERNIFLKVHGKNVKSPTFIEHKFSKPQVFSMNILYLHGLESKLSAEKREILKPYGNIFAPDLDYHKNPNSIESIIKDHETTPIDVVIGSSMGGFAGYYVSSLLNVPALLFNPALYARSVPQVTPALEQSVQNYKRIILGLEDDIVDPSRTLRFLSENLETQGELEIKLRPKMQHRVAVPVFEEELRDFFRTITPGNTI